MFAFKYVINILCPLRFFLACLSYPNCNAALWLPESVEQISVIEEQCQEVSNIQKYIHMCDFDKFICIYKALDNTF